MAAQTMTYQQKVKSYLKIFWILVGLTILELFFVEMHKFIPGVPHLLTTILVCTSSLAKAVYVAWYFMHLNHETPWLRKLVLLSMTCFFYAAVLITDTIRSRPMVQYIPEPARVHANAHHESAEASHAATEAPKAAAAAPEASAPAATPAASEGAEWK